MPPVSKLPDAADQCQRRRGHDSAVGRDADRREKMKVICGQRNRTHPCRQRKGKCVDHIVGRDCEESAGQRGCKRVRQQRIAAEEFALKPFVDGRHNHRDASDDKKGKLKAGLEKLFRLPNQDDQCRREQSELIKSPGRRNAQPAITDR